MRFFYLLFNGNFIVKNMDIIELSVRSLWWWVRCNMEKAQSDIDELFR